MEKRLELALMHFGQALQRLQEVVALPEDLIVRDALIKRFEFTFEAGWKAAYRWLRARGDDVDEGAYEVLPEAFKRGLNVKPSDGLGKPDSGICCRREGGCL